MTKPYASFGQAWTSTSCHSATALNVQGEDFGIKCQHGPLECALNRVINCVQHLEPELDKWLPFTRCLEARARDNATALQHCARAAGIDAAALGACSTGPVGDRLEREAHAATAALSPPHTYVRVHAHTHAFVCADLAAPVPPPSSRSPTKPRGFGIDCAGALADSQLHTPRQ